MIDPKTIEEITPAYLNEILSRHRGDTCPRILKLSLTALQGGFISNLGGQIIRVSLEYECQEQEDCPSTVILKANPSDTTTYHSMLARAQQSQSTISVPYIPNLKLNNRELMSYKYLPNHVNIGMPTIYHTMLDEANDRLWIIMEDLRGALLLDADLNQRTWGEKWLLRAMEHLAQFHASWWNNAETWKEHDWIFIDPPDWIQHTGVAIESNRSFHPRFVTDDRYKFLHKMLERLPSLVVELSSKTTTLVHGNCSPRNACFQQRDGVYKLTLYDWSFTGVSHPGEDVSEFLLAILSPIKDWSLLSALLGHYFESIPSDVIKGSYEDFYRGVVLSALIGLCSKLMACAWSTPERVEWLFQGLEYGLQFLEKTEPIWSDC